MAAPSESTVIMHGQGAGSDIPLFVLFGFGIAGTPEPSPVPGGGGGTVGGVAHGVDAIPAQCWRRKVTGRL